jgi:hypothetical protein
MIYSGKIMQRLSPRLLKYDYCEKSHALSLELGCRGNCCYSITNNYQRRIILALSVLFISLTRRLCRAHQPKTHLVGQLFSQIEPQNAHTPWLLSARNEHRDAAAAKKAAFFAVSQTREDHEDPHSSRLGAIFAAELRSV